jgi:hypothetical protein
MCHANSPDNNRAVHALRLLRMLIEQVQRGELPVTRNPAAPFSAVLSAVAKTPPTSAVTGTGQKNLHESGSEFGTASDKDLDPYSIATKVYDELRSDQHGMGTVADHHAVSAYLRCIAQHCNPNSSERSSTARMVFEEACENGHVSRLVVQGLHMVLGNAIENIPPLMSGRLPSHWDSNVPNAFRYRGKMGRGS